MIGLLNRERMPEWLREELDHLTATLAGLLGVGHTAEGLHDFGVMPPSGRGGGVGVTITSGKGTPEGAVVGRRGDLYLRTDGSAATTLYVKTANDYTTTGWTAK